MKKNSYLLLVLAALLACLPAGVHAQLSVVQPEINLGILSEDDAPRTCTFVCKNSGKAPVVITRVQTSCGCTAAEVDSPRLQPGEEARIKVSYEPLGHPGRILTYIQVFVQGADERPAATFTLTGKVTPSAALWKEFRYAMGNLRLRRTKAVFKEVKTGQRRTERIVCANAGSEPLTLKADRISLPQWLSFRTVPEAIPAGEEGVIELTVDGSKLPEGKNGLRARILLEGLNIRPAERMIEVVIN